LWSARNGSALAMLTLVALLVSGCAGANKEPPARSDFMAQILEVDLGARHPQRVKAADAFSPPAAPQAATYRGDGSPVTAKGLPASGARSSAPVADATTTGALTEGAKAGGGDKGYEINFENTPVATVAKAILGDIVGVGYTIDPRVQGTVSLSSGRAVPKKDLLYVLESALRVSNIALVREGRGYRLVPAAEAVAAGAIDREGGPEAGYGISVIPLQFVSSQTLIKLLENFAAKPGMVRAEPSRNLLIIQGNSADRRAAIETVLSFDADWMIGQSVGIYPINNSTPEPIIAELERIIDAGEGGLSHNLVKLEPISRQNAILVVARKPELLKRVATWITRLDKAGGAGTDVKVYRMRYGDARQVAALLNDMFLGSSASGLDSPTNQLVPGGGAIASNSGRSAAAGSQQLAGAMPSPASAVSQQPSTTPPASFNTRFADAAGGRIGQRPAAPSTGIYGRSGAPPLLANVRITPDVVNNALLIYANQENYRIIERALQQIDRPQLQVAIDATIAEITLNDALRYGVQFFLKSKDVGLKADTGSILNTAAKAVLSQVVPGFNFLIGTQAEPRLIIDALHQVTDVKILSTPSVVVVDNQFATLQVGDEIPITTRTAQSVDVPTAPIVNNIDYRSTGVILRVAPRINANGNVLLEIEQEISAVANTATADTLTPTVSQRRVRSSIAVASGQTVLLAGLISERQERSRNGIPGLDQLPGIGELFSTRNSGTVQRTELIIFIRPQIIRHGVDASRIAQELRAKMRGFRTDAAGSPPAAVNTKKPKTKRE
jgi:general secretion pathway protein D